MAKNQPGKTLTAADRREVRKVVAELLARRVSNAKICQAVSAKFSLSVRAVERYIAAVLKEWRDEDDERQSYRRTQTRRSLEGIVENALMGDERYMGKDDQGRPVWRRVPDRRAAVQASRLLARVDGLLDTEERSAMAALLDRVLDGLADDVVDEAGDAISPSSP